MLIIPSMLLDMNITQFHPPPILTIFVRHVLLSSFHLFPGLPSGRCPRVLPIPILQTLQTLMNMPSPLWSVKLPSDVQNLSCCGNIAPVWPVPMNIQVVFVAVSSFWLFQVSFPLSVTECQMPKVAHLLFFQINFPVFLLFYIFNHICNFSLSVVLKCVGESGINETKECLVKFNFNLTLFWRPLTGGQHLYSVALSGIASAFSIR